MPSESSSHFKRNFALGVVNGALVNFGLAFVDPFTVLPVFITRLGGSSVLIGVASAVFSAGWFLPQVFVARIAQSRERVLPIYTAMSLLRTLGYAGATVAVFLIPVAHPHWIIATVIVSLTLATVCAGVAGVPFLEITSKAIPVTSRGAFFGVRRLSGGFLGIFAGLVVAVVLGATTSPFARGALFEAARDALGALGLVGRAFPTNYGILFILGGASAALGLTAFNFLKETPAPSPPPRASLREHFAAGFALFREQGNYRLFLVVRLCWQLTAMAFPFYAAYAYSVLGFSEASVGVFVSVWVGSGVVSNFVWGMLADRRGNRLVLVATAMISLVSPIVMVAIDRGPRPTGEPSTAMFWIVAGTFLVNGFARSGRFISNMTYLLEAAPPERRPLLVGFMNSLSFPFMLSPVLAGLLVGWTSYQTLFVASAVFAIVNIVLSGRLLEPRHISVAPSPDMT